MKFGEDQKTGEDCFVASRGESSKFEGLPRTHLLEFGKSDHKF